jgi:hypothetical protein
MEEAATLVRRESRGSIHRSRGQEVDPGFTHGRRQFVRRNAGRVPPVPQSQAELKRFRRCRAEHVGLAVEGGDQTVNAVFPQNRGELERRVATSLIALSK